MAPGAAVRRQYATALRCRHRVWLNDGVPGTASKRCPVGVFVPGYFHGGLLARLHLLALPFLFPYVEGHTFVQLLTRISRLYKSVVREAGVTFVWALRSKRRVAKSVVGAAQSQVGQFFFGHTVLFLVFAVLPSLRHSQ